MSRFGARVPLAAVLVAALVASLATGAQAGTRLYSGSLIIEAFGNDTTDGNQPPFQTFVRVGIPLTGNCNTAPYHAKETLMFTSVGSPPRNRGPSRSRPMVGAVPQGTATPPVGCGDATVAAGDPLTGSGAAATSGSTSTTRTPMNPRAFTLPASDLSKVKSGASFELYGVYRWEVHFADLRNATGMFAKSGGDGSFALQRGPVGNPHRRVNQTAGSNQFGGVMRMLGFYGDNEGYYFDPGNVTSVFIFSDWLFEYVGGGSLYSSMGELYGSPARATHYGYTRDSGSPVTSIVYAEFFKWTTGMVTVEANQGTFPTHQVRTGYDNRTAMGSGVIQMVSPMLTHWVGSGESSTAEIGVLRLTFAPEPSEWMMLAGGVSLLGLIFFGRRFRD